MRPLRLFLYICTINNLVTTTAFKSFLPKPSVILKSSNTLTSPPRLRQNRPIHLTSIPDEYLEVITTAESKTPAASERKFRVIGYSIGAILCITLGVITAAATGGNQGAAEVMEYLPGGPGVIGCAIDTLGAGFFGTFVFLEIKTAEENRVRIYEEIIRRSGEGKGGGGTDTKKKKKKRKGGNVRGKRMGEIASLAVEVSGGEDKGASEVPPASVSPVESSSPKGVFSAAKDFYKRADEMAASQALLLNKELEERGFVEKITDETGLKVIGKGGTKGTGWADPDWNWGSAVGKAHDKAMDLRGRLNEGSGVRREWMGRLSDDGGMVEEGKLALGLRVQQAARQGVDGEGRGWELMQRMVALEFEGGEGGERLTEACNELADFMNVEKREGGSKVGTAIGRALEGMQFLQGGL
jgi:hypothetical protein